MNSKMIKLLGKIAVGLTRLVVIYKHVDTHDRASREKYTKEVRSVAHDVSVLLTTAQGARRSDVSDFARLLLEGVKYWANVSAWTGSLARKNKMLKWLKLHARTSYILYLKLKDEPSSVPGRKSLESRYLLR